MNNQLATVARQYTLKALVAALGLTLSVSALAADTAQQIVNFEVQAINEIVVSGDPGPLTISETTAGGSVPKAVTDSTTNYSITTNEANRKITASLNSDMPSGVTLTVNMTAPTGAASTGAVTLSATAVDAVTGISTLNEGALGITYELSATSAAGVVAPDTRTVTFTIVAGA